MECGNFDDAKDMVPVAFRSNSAAPAEGKFELYTEDLTWNKCGKLIAGEICEGRSQGMAVQVSSALLKIGGNKIKPGFAVESNTLYSYSFDAKSAKISNVIFNINEYRLVDGKEKLFTRCIAGPGRICSCRGTDWKTFKGVYKTSGDAVRAEITLQLWTMTGGRADADKDFLPGDYVLIDNVVFEKDKNFVKLQNLMANPPSPLVVALYSPMSECACPFLPVELSEPPNKIAFRAAINEQRPLSIAIGNFTESFQQYRVVLETEPKPPLDNGEFGLAGFPGDQIKMREALRFRDTDAAPETTRLDPLVEMNGAKVIGVPAKEAGAVWFDFDTRGVKAGVYRGRLRVIPLTLGADYEWKNRRYIAKRTSEVVLPVEFTVDPIELPREAVRPAHLCSPCQSEQGFELECDLGGTILALDTALFRPEAVGDKNSVFHKTIADYLAWGKRRGVKLTFFIKYNAYAAAQAVFKENAWEKYVHLIATLMNEAGVAFEDYYVLVQDEPKYENLEWVNENHKILKTLYPKMQTYVSCGSRIRGPKHFLDIIGENVDLWMIGEDTYNRADEIKRFKKLRSEKGVKLATYRCKTFMKAPLSAYFRRNCWRGEYLDFDSDMFYQFNIWNRGVRGEMGFKWVPQGELSYKADGNFFPSVRYMAYREGVTDIKYIEALRKARGNEPKIAQFIRKIVEDVMVKDPDGAEKPAEKREEVRRLLLGGSL